MTLNHNACGTLPACILFHTFNIQSEHCNRTLLIPTLYNLHQKKNLTAFPYLLAKI